MKKLISLGIIAEYNPFHTGHAYHLSKSKELTGSECVIVVMSGSFVQRGEPAIMDKYTRARMALMCGADLVIELPVISASASAGYFSDGAVSILDMLNIDYLCFGSETGDIDALNSFIDFYDANSDEINSLIHSLVSEGISYPLARSMAIDKTASGYSDIIKGSNNILGIEYLRSLRRLSSSIKPCTLKRIGNNYNDSGLSGTFSSAASIRNNILNHGSIPSGYIPKECLPILNDYISKYPFISIDDFTDILKYRLLNIESGKYIPDIADMPQFLLNKLINCYKKCNRISDIIGHAKTRELTYARISRAIIHLLLNIQNSDYENAGKCNYIRVLGLNDTGAAYLSSIKRTCPVPIITKPANYSALLEQDIFASDLYNIALNRHSEYIFPNDFSQKIIKL